MNEQKPYGWPSTYDRAVADLEARLREAELLARVRQLELLVCS